MYQFNKKNIARKEQKSNLGIVISFSFKTGFNLMIVHFYIRRNFAYPFIEMLRFQLENDVHKMHKLGIVQKLIKNMKIKKPRR